MTNTTLPTRRDVLPRRRELADTLRLQANPSPRRAPYPKRAWIPCWRADGHRRSDAERHTPGKRRRRCPSAPTFRGISFCALWVRFIAREPVRIMRRRVRDRRSPAAPAGAALPSQCHYGSPKHHCGVPLPRPQHRPLAIGFRCNLPASQHQPRSVFGILSPSTVPLFDKLPSATLRKGARPGIASLRVHPQARQRCLVEGSSR